MTKSLRVVQRNFTECFGAISLVLENRLIQPALVLLYSTMDAAASLERARSGEDVSSTDFRKWTTRYVLRDRRLQCTALELYGARCGVLHSFSAHSRLSRGGKCRTLGYAWGEAKVEDLRAFLETERTSNVVGVQVEHLAEALEAGFYLFVKEVRKDKRRLLKVLANAQQQFDEMPVVSQPRRRG